MPHKFAARKSALASVASLKSAPLRSAPEKSASSRVAPRKDAPRQLLSRKFAERILPSLKSIAGRTAWRTSAAFKISTRQIRFFQMQALQKRAGHIHSHQRHAVLI